MFFSKSASKQRLITKFLTTGLVMGFACAGIAFYQPTDNGIPNEYGKLVSTEVIPVPQGQAEQKLLVKGGCKIATFGIAPWLRVGGVKDVKWERSTRAALKAMSLPPEAVDAVMVKMVAGKPDDVIEMGNKGGVASGTGELYYANHTNTFKSGVDYAVCHDTITAFANDERREYGKLYKVSDASGQTYSIGEFMACNNVSRFYPDNGLGGPGGIAGPGGAGGPNGANRGPLGANEIPEPAGILLFILALVFCFFLTKRGKIKT